jgi:hypothetical protein
MSTHYMKQKFKSKDLTLLKLNFDLTHKATLQLTFSKIARHVVRKRYEIFLVGKLWKKRPLEILKACG